MILTNTTYTVTLTQSEVDLVSEALAYAVQKVAQAVEAGDLGDPWIKRHHSQLRDIRALRDAYGSIIDRRWCGKDA
ncbi:MAG: hypothetical protein IKD88_00885 [Lachnospiraceae bacterium]|nr:hypothetical protein [Lachnospiraceae bacterium]